MELAQGFIVAAGWIFFAAWGMVVAALGVIAFGREILPAARRAIPDEDRS